MNSKSFLLFLVCILTFANSNAQYAPPAGQTGTTAVFRDSSIIIGWAKKCVDVRRGYIDISDTTIQYNGSNKADFGSVLYVNGPSDEFVMSLGDGGEAVLTFDQPIGNGSGPDFAVFENSFSDTFLELAFVEVSSDGSRFVRFPSVSLTDETLQISTFGTSDATRINNFAGKYRAQYGTPFDLDDVKDSTGINLNHITHIKIIDAIGCLLSPFCTFDSQGHKVNDPWPTPFDTGGFDLDAIGVMHYGPNGIDDNLQKIKVRTYPNPVLNTVTFVAGINEHVNFTLCNPCGMIIRADSFTGRGSFDLSEFNCGLYIAHFSFADGSVEARKIFKK
jgi:hypothetical protein